jgi:hypothetical protein
MNDVHIKNDTLMIPLSGEAADSIVAASLESSRELILKSLYEKRMSLQKHDESADYLRKDISDLEGELKAFNDVLEYYGW